MKRMEQYIKKPKGVPTFDTPYDAGFNAGMYGASTFNSHFSWFSTKEKMEEWQRGNKAGSAKRETAQYKSKIRRR